VQHEDIDIGTPRHRVDRRRSGVVQLDHDQWLLELFHGPTLAFKDVALQMLGLLFECGVRLSPTNGAMIRAAVCA
jgi:threonine synthase